MTRYRRGRLWRFSLGSRGGAFSAARISCSMIEMPPWIICCFCWSLMLCNRNCSVLAADAALAFALASYCFREMLLDPEPTDSFPEFEPAPRRPRFAEDPIFDSVIAPEELLVKR